MLAFSHFLSGLLNAVHRPIGKYRLQRHLHHFPADECLEFGALQSRRSGWIQTDVHWRCQNYLDVTKRWPISDGRFAFIFSDNVVEHLRLNQTRFALREAWRVLRPGGHIRLVTPDVNSLVRLYLGESEEREELFTQLKREGYSVEHDIDVLRFVFQDDGHHAGYLWDLAAMEDELNQAGFVDVKFLQPGESAHEVFRGIDARIGTPISNVMLAAEATKPARA